MAKVIPYKSYSWSIGTTSLRMSHIHRKIEEALEHINEFRSETSNKNTPWQEAQLPFYDFILAKKFITGDLTDAKKKKKTARQKTSGITDLYLITPERFLTPVGERLLQIKKDEEYKNIEPNFRIPIDSFLYFKQLLKMKSDDFPIRPYMAFIKILHDSDWYLTEEEFTYLLPLSTSAEKTAQIISSIKRLRNNETTIDNLISEHVLSNDNYQQALMYLLEHESDEETIRIIGMNRDGKTNDLPYHSLYHILHKIFIDNEKTNDTARELANCIRSLPNSKVKTLWNKLFFIRPKSKKNAENLSTSTSFENVTDEEVFKRLFFYQLHLFKIKTNLKEYADLHRRYIGLSDSVIFSADRIEPTAIFKYYFEAGAFKAIDSDYDKDFLGAKNEDITLEEINPQLAFNEEAIIEAFNQDTGESYRTIEELYNYFEKQRYQKFDALVNYKFTRDRLVEIFNLFKERVNKGDKADKSIIEIFDKIGADCDDTPTLFEYAVGVAWYKASGMQGKVLDYMNLSLETNLLPRNHAGGFDPDINYEYDETDDYPKHTAILECTLMNGTNQRRGEMEPVTRHLGTYILEHKDRKAYCAFIGNTNANSVVYDFRSRRKVGMWIDKYDELVEEAKILSLDASDMANIVQNGFTYKEIYNIFEAAYNDECFHPVDWRNNCISEPFSRKVRTKERSSD